MHWKTLGWPVKALKIIIIISYNFIIFCFGIFVDKNKFIYAKQKKNDFFSKIIQKKKILRLKESKSCFIESLFKIYYNEAWIFIIYLKFSISKIPQSFNGNVTKMKEKTYFENL